MGIPAPMVVDSTIFFKQRFQVFSDLRRLETNFTDTAMYDAVPVQYEIEFDRPWHS